MTARSRKYLIGLMLLASGSVFGQSYIHTSSYRVTDSLKGSRVYTQYLAKYYCPNCPYKKVVFTNVYSGSNDDIHWVKLDSAYIKKWIQNKIVVE